MEFWNFLIDGHVSVQSLYDGFSPFEIVNL